MNFVEKVTSLIGGGTYEGSFDFASNSNIRYNILGEDPFPFRYNYDAPVPTVGSLPTLPDSAYPIGAIVKDSFSQAPNLIHVYENQANVWVQIDDKNYVQSLSRDQNNGLDEMNARVWVSETTGIAYRPRVVNDVYPKCTGLTSSARIVVPSATGQNNGGYIDLSIKGHDELPHTAIGPHNGGEFWYQYYFMADMDLELNDSFPQNLAKMSICGAAPTDALEPLGTSPNLAGVIGFDMGWDTTRNGLFKGYTRKDHPLGFSGQEDVDERQVGANYYMQTGAQALCPLSFPAQNYTYTYNGGPCSGLVSGKWYEVTEMRKLNPVASNFTVSSGGVLTRATNTFTMDAFEPADPSKLTVDSSRGRWVYIVGDGFYEIASVQSSTQCTLTPAPPTGTNKTVYISGYPNSTLARYINAREVVFNTDQRICWDFDGDTELLGFGQIRLQPHMTNKNQNTVHTEGAVYYAALIFASGTIPMMSHMEQVSTEMNAGTFALYNQESDNSGWDAAEHHYEGPPAGQSGDFSYTTKAAYHEDDNDVWICAGEHAGHTHTFRHDIELNTWFNADAAGYVDIPVHPNGSIGNVEGVHSYDTNVVIPQDDTLYVCGFRTVWRKKNLNTGVWSSMANPSIFTSDNSMEYFPERDELLLLQSGYFGNLKKYNRGSNTWSTIFTGGGSYNPAATGNNSLDAIQLTGAIIRYVPTHGCCLFMGGIDDSANPNIRSRALIKYDSTGNMTRLADVPASIWMMTQLYVAWIDPVTGNLLIINSVMTGPTYLDTAGTFEMWQFDIDDNTWTELDFDTIVPTPNTWFLDATKPDGICPVSLPRYGVTMLLQDGGNGVFGGSTATSKVFLYKHSDDVTDLTPDDLSTFSSLRSR